MSKARELLEKFGLFQPMHEMSNVEPEETGLDHHIWISAKTHSAGPRIKVSLIKSRFSIGKNFSVSISHDPMVVAGSVKSVSPHQLKKIFDFVKLNHEPLTKLWNGEISHKTALNALKKV
jgi:hypothetical protein